MIFDLKKIRDLVQGTSLQDEHEIPVSEGAGANDVKKYNIGQIKANIVAAVTTLIGTITKGDTGAAGATGPQGIPGEKGVKGDKGDKGDTGLKGDLGPTGPAGIQGPNGQTGLTGPQGPQGIQGAQGPQGPQGEQGPAGVDGEIIVAGEATNVLSGTVAPTTEGVNGDFYIDTSARLLYGPKAGGVWPAGTIILTGPTGPQGPQGIQGEQGEQGPAGADGIQGEAGLTGPQGIQGEQGLTGVQGPAGATGADGADADLTLVVSGENASKSTLITSLLDEDGLLLNLGTGGYTIENINLVDIIPDIINTAAFSELFLVRHTNLNSKLGFALVSSNDILNPSWLITFVQAVGVPHKVTKINQTGPQGPAGADGATGPQGPAGADGATGPQGPAGADGATGPQGPAGADGATGATGPQGPTGATGPAGSSDLPSGGTTAQYFRGNKTLSTFSVGVLATLLTGLTAAAGTPTATDSILVAFNKVLNFINNIATTVRGTALTGLSTATSTAITAADNVLTGFGKAQAQINLKVSTSEFVSSTEFLVSAKSTGLAKEYEILGEYLTGVDDSAGARTSAQLNTAFPNAKIGQKVQGLGGRIYEKRTATIWFFWLITTV